MILCALSDIAEHGAKGPFAVTVDGQPQAVFVVRQGDRVTAFVNRCPHVGAPLEMERDKFLDLTGTEILCTMHGARFETDSGLCTLGPCKGKSLSAVPVVVQDGMVATAFARD